MESEESYSRGRLFAMTGALAAPAIVSNITVPLLGLSDTFITGHLGSERFIAAVAVGTMMANAVYWLCGFLRMGTTGLSAEAFGAHDDLSRCRVLSIALFLALATGLAMILLSPLLSRGMLAVMSPPGATAALAREYFMVNILGAPAMLGVMALSGWMVGSQNTVYPMIIAISVNVINIAASFTLVFLLDAGFIGVAYGTTVSNWIGLLMALPMAKMLLPRGMKILMPVRELLNGALMSRFFRVNGSLFVRSACLMSVSFALTSYAGRMGDMTLAVNAILMQFFLFFSYFMDGFAFGGEALCGRFAGARDMISLRRSILVLGYWSAIVALGFTILYLFFTPQISALITDEMDVVAGVESLGFVSALLPSVSVAAFMFDGVYVGLTSTWRMMVATMAGAAGFFGLHYIMPAVGAAPVTTGAGDLWIAFMVFLFLRGAVLAGMLPATLRSYEDNGQKT